MHALVARESRLMKAPAAKMQAGSNSVQRLQPSIPTPALLYDRLWLRKYMKELKKEGEDKRKKERQKENTQNRHVYQGNFSVSIAPSAIS